MRLQDPKVKKVAELQINVSIVAWPGLFPADSWRRELKWLKVSFRIKVFQFFLYISDEYIVPPNILPKRSSPGDSPRPDSQVKLLQILLTPLQNLHILQQKYLLARRYSKGVWRFMFPSMKHSSTKSYYELTCAPLQHSETELLLRKLTTMMVKQNIKSQHLLTVYLTSRSSMTSYSMPLLGILASE